MTDLATRYLYLGQTLAEWRAEGQARLTEQQVRCQRFEDYYDGERVSSLLGGDAREIFKQLLPMSRTNWSELVVNAVAERLRVRSFRFQGAEDRAWTIWQASEMDSVAEVVQTDALVCGSTYVSVWPDDENPTGIDIVAEHPTEQVLIYRRRRGRRQPVAAYKRERGWGIEGIGAAIGRNGMAENVEQLITRDAIFTWTGLSPEPAEVEANLAGRIPVVELAPQPRTVLPPRSELHSVIPIQDRINLQIYNRMVAMDFGAFRQVTATGIRLPRGPNGEYLAPFNVGADRLLASENEHASFGVIPESSLTGYISTVESDVQHLAAITQTPPHYLLGQMVNISADALKAAEVGLVSKVKRRQLHLGQAWEDVMRLALALIGDPAADQIDAETDWADAETRSEGQTVDAAVKLRSLGLPLQVVWERLGFSPQQIERIAGLAADEAREEARNQAAALGATDPFRTQPQPPPEVA